MKKNPLLPVTSVDRPDWGFLSDVLGRSPRLSPPADHATAVALLKGTLFDAYAHDPNKLVMMACHPKSGKGKSQALDYFRQEMGMQDGLDYVTSRLLNARDDAGTAVVRNAARGSSHHGIDYWDPERCGVAPYIKARVGYIIQSYYSQKKDEPHHESLDEMAARRIDIDTHGEVVRQYHGIDSDDLPDLNEHDGELPTSRIGGSDIDEEVENLPLNESTGYQEIVERIASAERELAIAEHGSTVSARLKQTIATLHAEASTRLRAEVEAEFAARPEWSLPMTPEAANSLSRPDIAFFSKVLPPEKSAIKEGDIPEQIRGKTRELLDILKPTFEPEDHQILSEDIDESWDPSKENLFHRYPEIVSAAIEYSVDAEYARRSAEEIPSLHAAEVQMENQLMIRFDSTPSVEGKQSGSKQPESEVRAAEVWRARATPEDLERADRREDYLFFCERMGIEPNTKLQGPALHAAVKDVARQWVVKTAKFSRGTYLQALEDYNPAEDGFFTEVILDTMRNASTPQLQKQQDPVERTAALIAELKELRDTNDHAEPELF